MEKQGRGGRERNIKVEGKETEKKEEKDNDEMRMRRRRMRRTMMMIQRMMMIIQRTMMMIQRMRITRKSAAPSRTCELVTWCRTSARTRTSTCSNTTASISV